MFETMVALFIGVAIGTLLSVRYFSVIDRKRFSSAHKRDNELAYMYREMEREWSEQNNATNFSVWFEHMLDAMPQEAIKSNATLKIFEDELLINSTPITRDELWNKKN